MIHCPLSDSRSHDEPLAKLSMWYLLLMYLKYACAYLIQPIARNLYGIFIDPLQLLTWWRFLARMYGSG